MYILGTVVVPRTVPNLTYHVERGGTLIIASCSESSVHMRGGLLRIVYNQLLSLALYGADRPGGTVELVEFPDSGVDSVAHVGASYGWKIVRENSRTEGVPGPTHYTWIGEALARSGAPTLSANLQSWDLLDTLFPDNPQLWNVGKYLTRFGRKGGSSKRVEDLRKAAAYLERAIKAEENHAS
nr:MAG TPA: nucelotide kinase [Caudoviricetes sp.]